MEREVKVGLTVLVFTILRSENGLGPSFVTREFLWALGQIHGERKAM